MQCVLDLHKIIIHVASCFLTLVYLSRQWAAFASTWPRWTRLSKSMVRTPVALIIHSGKIYEDSPIGASGRLGRRLPTRPSMDGLERNSKEARCRTSPEIAKHVHRTDYVPRPSVVLPCKVDRTTINGFILTLSQLDPAPGATIGGMLSTGCSGSAWR